MLQASAYVLTHPSFVEPEIINQISQRSGFVDLLADSELRVRLAEDDLYVYMKTLNLRTKAAAGQTAFNELPGVDIAAAMISTATYQLQVAAQYNHHDVRAGANWGFGVPEAYRLGLRQANYLVARDAALYGLNPQNGEGIINAPGALAVNLPPDQFGNTTVLSYDNGQMAFFLAQQVQQMKTRTFQMGIGWEFTILGPQRTLGSFEYNVVELVQFQREGAGTASTKETLEKIIMSNKDKLNWVYDDTLEGKGAGGTDMVILDMPKIDNPKKMGSVDTNAFSGMTPNNATCVTQYADMAAPREILSPGPRGFTDVLQEWRISSGWVPRTAAVTLISMPFSK
jgi:hypothetical protein